MSNNYYVQQAGQKIIDKYKVQQDNVSRGTAASYCTDRLMQKAHASNVSLPSRKSVDSSRKSHTSKSYRSNLIDSQNASIQSEGIVCRICHEGDSTEVLVSPCYCSGSMGLLHVSCLQTWLGKSNKTTCEICNFQFSLVRKTMPISQFLRNPGTAQDKRNFICDILSFIVLTPLTVFVVWICLHGAKDQYYDSKLEKSGLISFSSCLLILYAVWLTVAIRHNWRLWNDWKMFHQEVTLLCQPSLNQTNTHKDESQHETSSDISNKRHGRVKLQSVKINISGPLINYKKPEKPEHSDVKKKPRTQSTERVYNDRGHGHNRFTPSDLENSDLEARSRSQERSKLYYKCRSLDEPNGNTFRPIPSNFQNSRNNTNSETQSSCRESNGTRSEKSSTCGANVSRDHERNHRYIKSERPLQQGFSYDGNNQGNPSNLRYYPAQRDYLPCGSQQVYSNPLYEVQARVLDNEHSSESNDCNQYCKTLYSGPASIFSRGPSPFEDQCSQDYITRWVNQHTKNNESGYNRNKLKAIKEMTKNPCHDEDKTGNEVMIHNEFRVPQSFNVPSCKTSSDESQDSLKHNKMAQPNPMYNRQENPNVYQINKSDHMNNINLVNNNVPTYSGNRYCRALVVNCDKKLNNQCDITNNDENCINHAEKRNIHGENGIYYAENSGTQAEKRRTHAENSGTQVEKRLTHAENSGTQAEKRLTHAENSGTHAEKRLTNSENGIKPNGNDKTYTENSFTQADNQMICAQNSILTAGNNIVCDHALRSTIHGESVITHGEHKYIYSRQEAMDGDTSQTELHGPSGTNHIETPNTLVNAQVSSLQTAVQNEVNSTLKDNHHTNVASTDTDFDDVNGSGVN